NKGIYTEGQVKAGSVRSEGRLSTGEFLQIDKVAIAGTPCNPSGLVGRDSFGSVLSCQGGEWKTSGNNYMKVAGTWTIYLGESKDLGRFKLCLLTYRIDGRETAITQLIPTDEPDQNGDMNWRAYNGTQYSSYYMGVHCFS
ncbi:shufflon system plasmid conjugative transfer pilus tip adhesin PilV, partial [Xenorhabdus nematophila]|uniref:shufflon system plasmid conjugative transfer pilus tip adhesin PilV n=1 Tax=Xenorhabdus nematophila TaxID=628 RepID=UPI0032B74549